MITTHLIQQHQEDVYQGDVSFHEKQEDKRTELKKKKERFHSDFINLFNFIGIHCFFLTCLFHLWVNWILKNVFQQIVMWSFIVSSFCFVFVILFFCFFIIPEILPKIHGFWKKIQKLSFTQFVFAFVKDYPKHLLFILLCFLFFYMRLEVLQTENFNGFISFLTFSVSFCRISVLSCLLLFRLFILDKKVESLWENTTFIRKHFIHSTAVVYGPANFPGGSGFNSTLANNALIAALLTGFSSDVAGRTQTVPVAFKDYLKDAFSDAEIMERNALRVEMENLRILNNLKHQDTSQPCSLIIQAMRDEKMKLAETALNKAKKLGDDARLLRKAIDQAKEAAQDLPGIQFALNSYLPNSHLDKARELQHLSFLGRSKSVSLDIETSQEISSSLEFSFYDFIPFF